jgi:uncharacterized membrane protein
LGCVLSPPVFWPCALGLTLFVIGLWTYRRDVFAPPSGKGFDFVALGPVFVAASLAAFAGEHFTAAKGLSAMVPKWLPARLFIAYFVGVAHLAAALSFVARRCIRWSAFFLAIMFALFVLLLHLPGAIRHPELRIAWIVSVRETTFAMGALALFMSQVKDRWPTPASRFATIARLWTGFVLIFFGLANLLYPALSPGVPDTKVTPSWVPLPQVVAYLTGGLLVVFGVAMFIRKYAGIAATLAGLLMLVLTATMYVPDFFVVSGVPDRVTAFNFVFDTLLFAGTMLLIANAVSWSQPQVKGASLTGGVSS